MQKRLEDAEKHIQLLLETNKSLTVSCQAHMQAKETALQALDTLKLHTEQRTSAQASQLLAYRRIRNKLLLEGIVSSSTCAQKATVVKEDTSVDSSPMPLGLKRKASRQSSSEDEMM
ncbi:hypothetical protein HGRIS_005083 [Hohenbuehelia grisea]|uniref:Uncharacterized protein n=1 Tax=Hohenbuehelia grisea TaxID=104357 RepID=A0ABR3JEE2_9AGAR